MEAKTRNSSVAHHISQWMRQRVDEAGAQGIVVGLSGGVDSAVVVGLARRAVGENVLGVLMPCHSQPVDAEFALLVAEAFTVKTATVSLGPVYDTFVAALPQGSDLARANLKPRLRMATLYYIANAEMAAWTCCPWATCISNKYGTWPVKSAYHSPSLTGHPRLACGPARLTKVKWALLTPLWTPSWLRWPRSGSRTLTLTP
jgi:hypothetical protein